MLLLNDYFSRQSAIKLDYDYADGGELVAVALGWIRISYAGSYSSPAKLQVLVPSGY